MHHYRKTYKKYIKLRKTDGDCPFCNKQRFKDVVYKDNYIYVVKNAVKYDLFDGLEVVEHLMIIPRRHLISFNEMNKAEKLAIINKMAEYESQDYSVYTRGKMNVNRSVQHHHTHIIKTNSKKTKLLLYMSKPHLLIKK